MEGSLPLNCLCQQPLRLGLIYQSIEIVFLWTSKCVRASRMVLFREMGRELNFVSVFMRLNTASFCFYEAGLVLTR